jgi:hypothetical protein
VDQSADADQISITRRVTLSGGLVKLWRISDWTQLGSYQIAGYSNGTWYTLTLRADGTALSVQVNGVTRITATDSTFTTGEAGLWSYASTAVSQHRFDDFVIQVLAGGHAPGGRLLAPEQDTGLFARLISLIREAASRIRNAPLAAPMTSRLSAPPAGQMWKTYYYAGSQLIALRVLTQTGNTLYYLHSDHLGSTSLTTDSSGNVTARQNYYPYGQIRPGGSGTMPTDIGLETISKIRYRVIMAIASAPGGIDGQTQASPAHTLGSAGWIVGADRTASGRCRSIPIARPQTGRPSPDFRWDHFSVAHGLPVESHSTRVW